MFDGELINQLVRFNWNISNYSMIIRSIKEKRKYSSCRNQTFCFELQRFVNETNSQSEFPNISKIDKRQNEFLENQSNLSDFYLQ